MAFSKEIKSLMLLDKSKREQSQEALHYDSTEGNGAMKKTGFRKPGLVLNSVLVGCLSQLKLFLCISI